MKKLPSRTSRLLTTLLAGAMAVSLVACGNGGKTPATSEMSQPAKGSETTKAPEQQAGKESKKAVSGELTVSAAASLTDCMKTLGESFNKTNPDLKITFNYGSSGTLQKQIEEGAPADLFVSAGQKQMDALADKDKIDKDSRVNLLKNEVVLIEPKDSSLALKDFKDVTKPEVKMIAIGDSSVPVGQYAQDVFTHLGIWDQVKTKANLGKDVRAVLAWVEQGEVSCGVVYATDAAITDKVQVVAVAPEGSHKPVIYPAALIKDCKNKEQAQAFLDFLKGPEAKTLFEKYGFKMAS